MNKGTKAMSRGGLWEKFQFQWLNAAHSSQIERARPAEPRRSQADSQNRQTVIQKEKTESQKSTAGDIEGDWAGLW